MEGILVAIKYFERGNRTDFGNGQLIESKTVEGGKAPVERTGSINIFGSLLLELK